MAQPPQTTPTAAPSTGVAPARVPASLHVAELDPRVDETVLMQIFSAVAQVASVKLVRDKVTSQSMGYAYINFESDDQAQLAMDKLNFSKIYGRVIRVSYTRDRQSSNTQPRAKRNNKANLYVKNLDPSIDSQQLYQLFKNFGAITSVRVMEHPDGKSKGFGFVCFENENDAQAAINDMNEFDLKGKPIHVSLAINQVQQGQGGGRNYQNQMMMMGPMGPVAVPPMGVVPVSAHGAPHPGMMVQRGMYEYAYDPTLYYGAYPAPYGYPAPYPPYGYLQPPANYPAENSSAAPSMSSTTQPQSQ